MVLVAISIMCLRSHKQTVIIWTNYDKPKFLMLHIKFHCNWLIGSGEDFWTFFNIFSMSRQPSWSWDQTHVNKFSFSCSYEIWFQPVQQFLRKTRVTLTFESHVVSSTHLVDCMCQLPNNWLQQHMKNRQFSLLLKQQHISPNLTSW